MARTHGLGAGHCGARLAAVQSGLMRAAVEEWFRRVLSFHSRVGEAEAMAVSVPAVAARLSEDDPDTYPPAGQAGTRPLDSPIKTPPTWACS